MQFKNSDNDSKLILSTHSALLYIVLSLLEFEVSGEDVIHEVVKVGSINQPLALIAWVHGSPTELVIDHLTFHEAPYQWYVASWLVCMQGGHCPSFYCLYSKQK